MTQPGSRTPLILAVVAVTALLAGTSGAVAGSVVTSAQIKNGTIKTKDLSPKARQQLRVVGGFEVVEVTEPFVGGDYHSGSFEAACPAGSSVLSAWVQYDLSTTSTIQLAHFPTKVRAGYIFMDDADNTGRLTVTCGRTSAK